jgi:hypothetical protein
VAAQQRQLAAAQRSYAEQQKEAEARRLTALFQQVFNLHRQPFPPAAPPVAPPPAVPDRAAILARHLHEMQKGTQFWQRAARKAAQARAEAATNADVATETARLDQERVRWQHTLDEWWARLTRNDPDTVLDALERAFEDNEAPAAAVGVAGDEVSLVVLAPGMDLIPERFPDATPTGRLTLKKFTAAERVALHRSLVYGHVLLTVKEALATAPGLATARVAVVRRAAPDAYGKRLAECVLAARFARADLDRVVWQQADAPTIVRDAATEVLVDFRGRTKEFRGLDLTAHPELAALLAHVDLDERVRRSAA